MAALDCRLAPYWYMPHGRQPTFLVHQGLTTLRETRSLTGGDRGQSVPIAAKSTLTVVQVMVNQLPLRRVTTEPPHTEEMTLHCEDCEEIPCRIPRFRLTSAPHEAGIMKVRGLLLQSRT
jgi:hypothetical protein